MEFEKVLPYYSNRQEDLDTYYPYVSGALFNRCVDENKRLQEELGKKGRKFVENYHDSKKVAGKLLKIYKSS